MQKNHTLFSGMHLQMNKKKYIKFISNSLYTYTLIFLWTYRMLHYIVNTESVKQIYIKKNGQCISLSIFDKI